MPEWQDLTQPITERVTTHPPGWPYPEFEAYKSHESDGVNATRVRIVTHCGTHMDAPSHFFSADDHGTIEDVTPDEMVTEGVVLDLTDVDRGAAITPADLDAATEGNPIEDGDFVVLDTGMDPTETDEETYLREYAYPGVAAAEYLVDAGAAVVATDALGVENRERASPTTRSTGRSSRPASASSRASRTSATWPTPATSSSARPSRTSGATLAGQTARAGTGVGGTRTGGEREEIASSSRPPHSSSAANPKAKSPRSSKAMSRRAPTSTASRSARSAATGSET